jgi:CRISPR-associated protein Csm4
VFRRWLAGDDLGSETLAENFVPASGAWTSGAEQPEVAALAGMVGEAEERALWARDDVPRVTVDRETSASAVYRVGRLSFRPGCGLFFLVDWRQESFRPRIEQALSLLADAGLGGRRSVGYGQFTPEEPYTLELGEVPMPTAAVTLSLYWPTPDELGRGALGPQAQYSLVTRHGWMASPWGRAVRRRQVRMLAEGSAIDAGARPVGGLVDVTPAGFGAHPVYRYGLAFPVGVAPGVRSSPEAGS